uniref:RNA helicase n=1 Tax=Parascaris univalens TaxID=6257 RepID=A0A915BN31_PARUN
MTTTGEHEHRLTSTARRPKFLKPPADDSWEQRNGPLVLEERLTESSVEVEAGCSIVYNNPYITLSIQQQRARLPIFKNRNHIIYLLEKYRTLIIVGETGCGKSTQIPQYLLEAGWAADGRKIGVTEPRTIAVVTLANRVAEEAMCSLGEDVGYMVRFDDMTNEKTKIKYMTDGILLRELMSDPLLTQYSIIMVDEAHERSINTDLVLGLLRKILSIRNDIRVIVSSATLDAILFRDFFELNDTNDRSKDTATILSVEGHMHPVTIYYTKSGVPDYIAKTVETVMKLHQSEPVGDILVFLTGQDEVEMTCQQLIDIARQQRNTDKLWIVPMYGALPAAQQLKAFDSTPHRTRKVVIATNIAEASVTIPGIAYVIDCGFVKMRAMNAENGLETLMTLPVSQAAANQRAGRAGRLRPGKCYRLYPQSEFDKMMEATVPEMQRCNLAPVILQLKALGIHNVLRFNYISRPPSFSMIEGLQLLYALGALSEDGHLTNPIGIRMAEFPLPPMHSKALLSSGEFGCSEEMAVIIAMLQIQDVFVFPSGSRHKAEVMKRKFSVEEGDHLTMLNVFTNFIDNGRSKQWCHNHYVNYRGLCRAENIRDQMLRLLRRYEVPIISCRKDSSSSSIIRRCLVKGFFSQAAQYHYTGDYVTVREEYHFKVYKGSAIMYRKEFPKWVIFSEVLQESIRDVSVIEAEWLYQLVPEYYEFGTDDEIARKRMKEGNEM